MRKTEKFSRGPKAGLFFAKMYFDKAEVSVFDERAGNLSPLSLPENMEALQARQGCIICVSHDRGFIEQVRTR